MSQPSDRIARDVDRRERLKDRVLKALLASPRGLTNVELHSLAPSADRRVRQLRKEGWAVKWEKLNERGLTRYWIEREGVVAAVAQRTSAQPMEPLTAGLDPARPVLLPRADSKRGQLDLLPAPPPRVPEYPR